MKRGSRSWKDCCNSRKHIRYSEKLMGSYWTKGGVLLRIMGKTRVGFAGILQKKRRARIALRSGIEEITTAKQVIDNVVQEGEMVVARRGYMNCYF